MPSKTPVSIDFIAKSLDIKGNDPFEAGAVGYSTRALAQASLPHKDPGDTLPAWIRRNGHICLSITPHSYINADGEEVKIGYPFGVYPRLLLIYLCRQAVITKSREITLGASLSSFMRELGIEATGGSSGTINRFKDQMRRLLYANISFTFSKAKGEEGGIPDEAVLKQPIAHKIMFWWNDTSPDPSSLFESYIVLSEDFYQEIIKHPVPLDMRAIAALRRTPLGLDLYTWLTYRVFWLKKPQKITWKALQLQIGSEYRTTKNFKQRTIGQLKIIHALWDDLKTRKCDGGFYLYPSPPHISQRTIPKL